METPRRKCHSFDCNPTFVVDYIIRAYDVWIIPSKYIKEENVCPMHGPFTSEYGEMTFRRVVKNS